MVTIPDVRRFALTLPLTTEGMVAGRVKFRIGRIVYVAFSRDEKVMGFAFPKDQRDWLVGGDPAKFMQPERGDLRYHWVLVRLGAIDETENARARLGCMADGCAQARWCCFRHRD